MEDRSSEGGLEEGGAGPRDMGENRISPDFRHRLLFEDLALLKDGPVRRWRTCPFGKSRGRGCHFEEYAVWRSVSLSPTLQVSTLGVCWEEKAGREGGTARELTELGRSYISRESLTAGDVCPAPSSWLAS